MITLFKEITTEEALQVIEKESEKWTGLYCDMDNKKERKFVKDESVKIESIRKKVERARIDKAKDYKVEIDKEAKSIDARLVAANKPFIELIDEYKEKRAKILAAEKAEVEAAHAVIQKENDHDYALLMNDKFDRESAESKANEVRLIAEREAAIRKEEAEKAEAENAKAIQDKIDAEKAAAQAIIDKRVAEELAIKLKADSDERAKLLAIQAKRDSELAAESARLKQIKLQEIEAKNETDRIAKIEADKNHVSSIRRGIKEQIMKDANIDEATAIAVVKSILRMNRIKISYE